MAGRQGVERRLLEVLGNHVVEPLLLGRGHEFLHQGMAVRVLDVFQHLLAQGPFADWLEPLLQVLEVVVVAQPGEAGAVGLQVAEGKIVDDAHQAVEFQERVLQRRGGQEHLAERGHALLDGVGDLVRGLVHVAEPVGFVDDHQIPACLADVRLHLPDEMVRTDNDGVLLEGIEVAGPDGVVEGAGFQDDRRQEELVGQFLAPLLPQIGRHDDQDATLPFRPALVDQEPGLDGLSQAPPRRPGWHHGKAGCGRRRVPPRFDAG